MEKYCMIDLGCIRSTKVDQWKDVSWRWEISSGMKTTKLSNFKEKISSCFLTKTHQRVNCMYISIMGQSTEREV